MKKSIAFLPKKNREDLKYIVSEILERIPVCEMIILYGSYARGTFVSYDERVEFGIPTTFKSDYDILVITSNWADHKVADKLNSVDKAYSSRGDDHRYRVTIQFIHDSIKKFNSDLEEGRYFYTELKRDGILLYDSQRFKLARRRKLQFDEIKEQAEGYFKEKYEYAQDFIIGAKFYFDKGNYKLSSFLLHQVCENFFKTISLVFTLRSDKEHNLKKLLEGTRGFAPELYTVFPLDNEEEQRLFKILVRAYIEARYNPEFEVSKEDVELLMAKAELFGEVTKEVCQRQIAEYEKKAKK